MAKKGREPPPISRAAAPMEPGRTAMGERPCRSRVSMAAATPSTSLPRTVAGKAPSISTAGKSMMAVAAVTA